MIIGMVEYLFRKKSVVVLLEALYGKPSLPISALGKDDIGPNRLLRSMFSDPRSEIQASCRLRKRWLIFLSCSTNLSLLFCVCVTLKVQRRFRRVGTVVLVRPSNLVEMKLSRASTPIFRKFRRSCACSGVACLSSRKL